MEVAIKTLKKEASEEEKVKFLQEAAINGQFHHPNIVKLHGVVTVGEPVSDYDVSYTIIHVHLVCCQCLCYMHVYLDNAYTRASQEWRYETILKKA